MTFPSLKSFLILSAAALLCTNTALADLSSLPEPQQEGDITYITGGIGDEERDALKDVEHDYNLHIMSASNYGAFVGTTTIYIRDRQGNDLLTADAGPIFYASLPPGRYIVEGEHNGESRTQNITIGRGKPAHVHFGWK